MEVIYGLNSNATDIFHSCMGIINNHTLRTMLKGDPSQIKGDSSKYKCANCGLHVYNYITKLVELDTIREFLVEH
jgi:hypothetical protein